MRSNFKPSWLKGWSERLTIHGGMGHSRIRDPPDTAGRLIPASYAPSQWFQHSCSGSAGKQRSRVLGPELLEVAARLNPRPGLRRLNPDRRQLGHRRQFRNWKSVDSAVKPAQTTSPDAKVAAAEDLSKASPFDP
jgi:hypothetical protein